MQRSKVKNYGLQAGGSLVNPRFIDGAFCLSICHKQPKWLQRTRSPRALREVKQCESFFAATAWPLCAKEGMLRAPLNPKPLIHRFLDMAC